jgi:pimeloyl-ACP methyl ester carboxylesterase
MQFNNQEIYYEVHGTGFPLVFLHGFCEDSSLWQMFVEPFKSKYQIVLIDLMGFGQSEVPKETSINYLAKATKAVLEELGIDKCLMIGHSMGGYTTLAFAELFPNILSGVCLFHSHPFADSEAKKVNRQKAINFIENNGIRPFLKQLIPTLFSKHFRTEHQEVIKQMIEKATNYKVTGIIAGLNAMKNRRNYIAVLENLTIPVLMIIGKEDEAISYTDSLKMSYLPKVADVQILEKVGHVGILEATEKTQLILQKFIDFTFS